MTWSSYGNFRFNKVLIVVLIHMKVFQLLIELCEVLGTVAKADGDFSLLPFV